MAVSKWTRRRTKHFGTVFVPFVQVELQTADRSFQAFALQVDSGAVVSLMRRSVAGVLGIELESGRRVDLVSVGGSRCTAFVHELVAMFDDELILKIPVAIADTESVPNLLGRVGVFDQLQCDFDPSLEETRITPRWLDDDDRRIWEHIVATSSHIQARWEQLPDDDAVRKATTEMYNHASRLVAAIVGLFKLHRHHETPILLRALFDVCAQFEFMMRESKKRSSQFLDFGHVVRYQQAMEFVRNPKGPISEFVANSEQRPEGEKRLRSEYDRVKGRFQTKKGGMWHTWYGFSMRDLATEIGWEREYAMWFRQFSNRVHFDPSQAHTPVDHKPSTLLFVMYHYFARMLLRIADDSAMILTGEQYSVLKKYAADFT